MDNIDRECLTIANLLQDFCGLAETNHSILGFMSAMSINKEIRLQDTRKEISRLQQQADKMVCSRSMVPGKYINDGQPRRLTLRNLSSSTRVS